MSKGPYTLGDKLQKRVSATRCSDKSFRVYWRIFEKIFVFATEFCRSKVSQKNQIRQNLYDLLRRQKFCCRYKDFHKKFSSTRDAFCHSDVSPQPVATTSRPICAHGVICLLVCSDLKHRLDQSQSGKLSARSHVQSSPSNVAFSFEVALSHTLYG